jgi:hypothetical protein
MLITLFVSNSSANIGESIQKNNKKSENFAFLLKKSCDTPEILPKNGYFS